MSCQYRMTNLRATVKIKFSQVYLNNKTKYFKNTTSIFSHYNYCTLRTIRKITYTLKGLQLTRNMKENNKSNSSRCIILQCAILTNNLIFFIIYAVKVLRITKFFYILLNYANTLSLYNFLEYHPHITFKMQVEPKFEPSIRNKMILL